jgi:hypothetical protein
MSVLDGLLGQPPSDISAERVRSAASPAGCRSTAELGDALEDAVGGALGGALGDLSHKS